MSANIDPPTARAFDQNWGAPVGKGRSNRAQADQIFADYFALFPFAELATAEGFDLGCGGGRHAKRVAPRVGRLHCIDQSPNAIASTRHKLGKHGNVEFHLASVDAIPLADASQDFGYSMGVLHHIPDTEAALRSCTAKLKPGAPFLLYLYYRFDNRPFWFRWIWQLSELVRLLVARLPFPARRLLSRMIGLLVYWPLSRNALLLEKVGVNAANFPLYFYRHTPLAGLGWSALDRFGTRLEQRFTRAEMEAMMQRCGLRDICFNPHEPYWVALGRKV